MLASTNPKLMKSFWLAALPAFREFKNYLVTSSTARNSKRYIHTTNYPFHNSTPLRSYTITCPHYPSPMLPVIQTAPTRIATYPLLYSQLNRASTPTRPLPMVLPFRLASCPVELPPPILPIFSSWMSAPCRSEWRWKATSLLPWFLVALQYVLPDFS